MSANPAITVYYYYRYNHCPTACLINNCRKPYTMECRRSRSRTSRRLRRRIRDAMSENDERMSRRMMKEQLA